MAFVTPKKHLGQHFLKDESIALKIVESLKADQAQKVLEIGPGMGVLTKYLIKHPEYTTYIIDLDGESIEYLKKHIALPQEHIIHGDFLKFNPNEVLGADNFCIIGNFPYNISSQILFRMLELRNRIPELVGMFQKEVAERVAEGPGSKTYGILSVLMQAFYNVEYLFTVGAEVFNPPPKVQSAVIRMTRNNVDDLGCDERLFFTVVKTGFNQRRKTLRNALKSIPFPEDKLSHVYFTKRAEQLSVADFVELTKWAMEARGK